MSTRTAALRWAVLALALSLLNVSLTFANVWPTLSVRLTNVLSAEAAICVLAIVAADDGSGARLWPSSGGWRCSGSCWSLDAMPT